MTDPRDTAPQPPPCCDPSAPVVKCCVCGTDVHTCERTEPVDNDYRCTLHGNGVELNAGEWVCSDACGYERMFAGYVARIAALEAKLAEAQERLAMAVEALNGTLGELQAVQATCALSGLPARTWAGFGGKAKKALAATAEAVAQHTASVEARAIKKHDERVASVFRQVANDPSITPLVGKPGSESAALFQRMIARVERRGAAKELRRFAEDVFGHVLWDDVLVNEIRRRAAELEKERLDSDRG